MTKERKSSVVYWTSEWKDSGKVEVFMNADGKQCERSLRMLVGEKNTEWRTNIRRY